MCEKWSKIPDSLGINLQNVDVEAAQNYCIYIPGLNWQQPSCVVSTSDSRVKIEPCSISYCGGENIMVSVRVDRVTRGFSALVPLTDLCSPSFNLAPLSLKIQLKCSYTNFNSSPQWRFYIALYISFPHSFPCALYQLALWNSLVFRQKFFPIRRRTQRYASTLCAYLIPFLIDQLALEFRF